VKISVVGMGRVGAVTAFALVARSVPHELVLVGRTRERTTGDAHDLQHAAAFVRPMSVVTGDVADAAGSDIVVLAASAASGTFADRLEQARPNARLMAEIVPPLAAALPRAVFVVLTNPVDVCTYVTLRSSVFPPGQVLGSGTLIDTARLRSHLACETGINAADIRA
jgi:L-lactate dehydrogenase